MELIRRRRHSPALFTAAVLALAPPLVAPGRAAAQGITTGALQGQVTDKLTGEPLVGVTVAAFQHQSSP